jgi:hypothetical protein
MREETAAAADGVVTHRKAAGGVTTRQMMRRSAISGHEPPTRGERNDAKSGNSTTGGIVQGRTRNKKYGTFFYAPDSRVSDPDPDPDWIRIQSGQWIRIQEDKNDP